MHTEPGTDSGHQRSQRQDRPVNRLSAFDQVQRLRADEVTESNQREKLQSVATRTSDGLYLVPRFVE